MRSVIAIAGRGGLDFRYWFSLLDFSFSLLFSSFIWKLINGNCKKSDGGAELHCLTSCNNLKIKLTPSCFQRFSQIGGETFPIFSLFFFILLKAFCARQYLVTGWWRLRESYLVNVPCLGKKRLIFIFARKLSADSNRKIAFPLRHFFASSKYLDSRIQLLSNVIKFSISHIA